MTARSSSSDAADQAEPHEGHVLDFQSSYRGEMTALALILLLLAIVLGGLVGFAAYTARQVEIADPPRGHFLELDGERIHYIDQGAGPPGLAPPLKILLNTSTRLGRMKPL